MYPSCFADTPLYNCRHAADGCLWKKVNSETPSTLQFQNNVDLQSVEMHPHDQGMFIDTSFDLNI
jgi:hypothetical protein